MNATTRLELLALEHARPLERFERANRAFFAARVGDRGEEYFEHFDDRLASRVRANHEGSSLYFVIVDSEGEVLGRINISDIDRPGLTELGFRLAEHAQGRGLASAGVISALEVAAARGVRSVTARASISNLASRRVLKRCGFIQKGPAQAPTGSSHAFLGYTKHLAGVCTECCSRWRAHV